MATADPNLQLILAEVSRASSNEARAYLLGAAHDGTVSRLHGTLRITQADRRWLEVLQAVLGQLSKRSWIYREGSRSVWTLETTYRLQPRVPASDSERIAFARGYFDAEGGMPRNPRDRFYIQLVQKNKGDLDRLRSILCQLGIQCGRMHNPSVMVDSEYWRFYITAPSQGRFVERVGSWHPLKRAIFEERRLRP